MNYETFVQSHSVVILKLSFATTTTENSGFATTTRAHARDSANKGGIPNATLYMSSRSGTLPPTGRYIQTWMDFKCDQVST